MPSWEFLYLLHGLSGESLYRDAVSRQPREVTSDGEAQAILDRM